LFGEILHEGLDALRHRRPRQHRIDGDRGAAGHLGEAARHRKLCGLGGAVVDHFLRNIQRGFRRDENDAAPIALQHAGQIGARQPHARHHIDLEEAAPVLVGNLEEVLRFEDAGIVDEDVHLRQRRDQRLAAGRRRDIGGDAATFAPAPALTIAATAASTLAWSGR
jgi:hypothetical protein